MGGLLMLYLGLRPGECCALTFGKITPTSDDLQVVHVVEQLDGENNIRASLKTKNAYRTLPIPTELVDQLKERRQFIQENLDPSQNIESCYLVNEESDFTNPCKRAHFNKYIKQKLLLAKVDEKAITYAETIIKSDTSVKETEPTTYLMRRNFATLMSSVCAMNNDELQYVMGHTLEHKKRRSDFIDPEILKHIAQKMNRRHLLSPFPNHTTTLNKGALRIEDVAQINLIATAESITSQQLPIVVDVYTNSPIDFITICCTSPVEATHTENADPSSVDQPVVICDFDSKQQSLENAGRINIEQAYYRAVNKNSNKITTLEQKLESSVKP